MVRRMWKRIAMGGSRSVRICDMGDLGLRIMRGAGGESRAVDFHLWRIRCLGRIKGVECVGWSMLGLLHALAKTRLHWPWPT